MAKPKSTVPAILLDRVNRSKDPNSPEYGGIGGSQVAGITGHDDFGRDALDVYYECTRIPERKEGDLAPESVDLLRGIYLEDDIADVTPLYYPEISMRRAPLARHPEERWAVVHIDRVLLRNEQYPDAPPGEIKAPRAMKHRRNIDEGLQIGYLIQMEATLFVKRKVRGVFIIGNFETQPPIYTFSIESAPATQKRIKEVGNQFWHDHVIPRIAPNPEEWKESWSDVPRPEGERATIEAEEDPALAAAVRRFRRLKKLEKRLKDEEIPEAREALRLIMDMKEVARLRVPGTGRAYLNWRKGRLTFSQERLQVHRPIDRDKLTRQLAEALGWELGQVEKWLSERDVDLDLDIFRRRGNDYRELRSYDDDG